jgi:hypothetical protein
MLAGEKRWESIGCYESDMRMGGSRVHEDMCLRRSMGEEQSMWHSCERRHSGSCVPCATQFEAHSRALIPSDSGCG